MSISEHKSESNHSYKDLVDGKEKSRNKVGAATKSPGQSNTVGMESTIQRFSEFQASLQLDVNAAPSEKSKVS